MRKKEKKNPFWTGERGTAAKTKHLEQGENLEIPNRGWEERETAEAVVGYEKRKNAILTPRGGGGNIFGQRGELSEYRKFSSDQWKRKSSCVHNTEKGGCEENSEAKGKKASLSPPRLPLQNRISRKKENRP